MVSLFGTTNIDSTMQKMENAHIFANIGDHWACDGDY